MGCMLRPTPWPFRPPHWKSDESRISPLPSRDSGIALMRSMSISICNRLRINIFALAARLPTISAFREFVATGGGLASYGANTSDIFRRAGDYVDNILRGAMPAELPVQQPTKFDLVINLITAKALGLTISPVLLARADGVRRGNLLHLLAPSVL
jgi:putative tryptophan/tyrosine transport system substrate-binding protein